jgi:hypothetical protein
MRRIFIAAVAVALVVNVGFASAGPENAAREFRPTTGTDPPRDTFRRAGKT